MELAVGHFAPFLPTNRWDVVVDKSLGRAGWVQINVWLWTTYLASLCLRIVRVRIIIPTNRVVIIN